LKIPLHVRIRRKIRSWFSKLLAKLFRTKKSTEPIDPKMVEKIIIVRPNYRIGNIIFLTPLLNELHALMPHAEVDIIVGSKIAGSILEKMPNVGRVIDVERKVLFNPLKLKALVDEIRMQSYSLCINISGGSFSSQLVSMLADASYRASFYSENNFMPVTHVVHPEGLYKHAGSKPLEFLKLFQGARLPKSDVLLDIRLQNEEKECAKEELKKLLEQYGKKQAVAIFRGARFDKKLPDEWWREFVEALQQKNRQLLVIDILSPDVPNALSEDTATYSNKNLRSLGAFFFACDAYVSADTGPLHLAAASGANTTALLNKTNPAVYGVLGPRGLNLEVEKMSVTDVADTVNEKFLQS